jgi:DNA-binding PadR family transcriptional regulator
MSGSGKATPDEHLPLKPLIFHILLALAEEERHGYAIMREVRERSGGRIRLETGPLYRHLKRLLDDGLVEESDYRPAPDQDDQRRRYYRLTAMGRAVMAGEAERMAELVKQIRRLGNVEVSA